MKNGNRTRWHLGVEIEAPGTPPDCEKEGPVDPEEPSIPRVTG